MRAMKKYLEIYQSQNWMLIGGKLLSKKLALWVTVDRSKNDTLLENSLSEWYNCQRRQLIWRYERKDMKNSLLC